MVDSNNDFEDIPEDKEAFHTITDSDLESSGHRSLIQGGAFDSEQPDGFASPGFENTDWSSSPAFGGRAFDSDTPEGFVSPGFGEGSLDSQTPESHTSNHTTNIWGQDINTPPEPVPEPVPYPPSDLDSNGVGGSQSSSHVGGPPAQIMSRWR